MQERDLIVVGVDPVAVGFEDRADADHAERVELRGTERAHAGRSEHGDTVFERQEDLLVPDRGDALEQAVDDGDGARPSAADAKDVTASHRRQVPGLEHAPRLVSGQ